MTFVNGNAGVLSTVEGLLDFPVSTFEDIEYYIEECNKNRTMAVTKMNETSRSGHTNSLDT